MKPNVQKILFWTPRVLCLLFATFISLFALDVLDEGNGFWPTALALLMHLIPTFILLATLALSWRWEWIGGVVFPALGLLHLILFCGRLHWSGYAVIAGPLFLVGTLFLLGWRQRKHFHRSESLAA